MCARDTAKEPAKSPYRQRREELGLSREKAAEILDGIQPERIGRIESGQLPARPEEVLVMSQAYKSPELCNHYCAHECAIGKVYVPETRIDDLSHVTLRMLSSINKLESRQKRFIEIAADGMIRSEEIEDFVDMQMELERLSVAIESLQLWTERMIAEGYIDAEEYEKVHARKAF